MRAHRTPVSLAGLVFLLVGCTQVEHWDAPNILGTVVANGMPVPDVSASYVETEEVDGDWVLGSCDNPRIVVTSDEDGAFRIDGAKRDLSSWRSFVPGSALYQFRLCLSHEVHGSMYWDYSHVGRSFPESIEIRCDIGPATMCQVMNENHVALGLSTPNDRVQPTGRSVTPLACASGAPERPTG